MPHFLCTVKTFLCLTVPCVCVRGSYLAVSAELWRRCSGLSALSQDDSWWGAGPLQWGNQRHARGEKSLFPPFSSSSMASSSFEKDFLFTASCTEGQWRRMCWDKNVKDIFFFSVHHPYCFSICSENHHEDIKYPHTLLISKKALVKFATMCTRKNMTNRYECIIPPSSGFILTRLL